MYRPTTAETLLDELMDDLGVDPDGLAVVPASQRTREVVAIAWDASRGDSEAGCWLRENAPDLEGVLCL